MKSIFSLLPLIASTALAGPLEERQSQYPILNVTPQQWAQFNQTLGGKLHQGVPWARPCFPLAGANVVGTYDQASCSVVQNNYKNDSYIANAWGAYQNSNWGTCQAVQNADCLLDYNAPQNPLTALSTCQQGSVSTYYVDIRTHQDVTASFAFAKKYNLPIAIKNSGHDYKGRSSAPYSLGLWTHNIQYITRNKNFVPAGCSSSKATDSVTFGAGNGFASLYEYGEANNLTIVGGSSETVGASGGWIMGGGHSSISNLYGLGVDRVLQFKMVTPDGVYRTVSACQNTDLWFALRGGGGSTFGLILETTTTPVPRLTIQAAYFKFASIDLNASKNFITVLVQNAQRWANEGWGGYIEPGAISSQTGGLVLFNPRLNNSAAKQSMAPVFEYVNSLGQVPINQEVTEVPSFFQAYQRYLTPNEELVDLGTAIASRLIPDTLFNGATNQQNLVNAIVNGMKAVGDNVLGLNKQGADLGLAYGGAPTQFLMTSPYNYKNYPSSAVTPAWRNTIWHVLYAPTFNKGTSPSAISQAFKNANTAADYLRALTPNSGAYQNEASIFEPNYQQSFWGQANYNRLTALKKQYDPNGLLDCWQCIGWKGASAPRYNCYPSNS